MPQAVIWAGVLGLALFATTAAFAADSTPDLIANSPIFQIANKADQIAAGTSAGDAAFDAVAQTIRNRQYNPLRAARAITALSVAQAEAAAGTGSESDAQSEERRQAAARQAGGRMLWWMFPQESHEPWLASRLAQGAPGIADEPASRAAGRVIERMLTDGADARRRPLAKPPWRPGIWQRTPPLLAEQPTEPQAPSWRPWCPGSEALQPPPPPEYGSARWRQDMVEVAAVSRTLTAYQKQAASYWNLDAGSVTPPGLWNQLVRDYLRQHPVPVQQHYRILALLNMAMHDALVAGWRVKLAYWTERPYTAIRREIDPAFEPLVPTPPFPGYVSGHAVTSGAAAEMLAQLLPQARGTWQALAEEAAMSRLWGGIHPRLDNEEGLALGRRVAQVCLKGFGSGQPLLTEAADTSLYSSALPRIVAAPE